MTNDLPSESPWSDESQETADIAGREDFARVVASRIDSCAMGQSSTVFGLVGPWGGGKTTLLKDVISRLDTWECVWFSPWSVSDAESITAEFVSALSEAFPKSKSVKDRLSQYSRFGTPLLKLIPVVGDAASSMAQEAITDLTKRPSWHSEFGKLSREIAEQDVRVLVIIDDVDRLDGDELRALLRVVRLLGRFTNVHYLLAYDQATIESALRSTGADGESSEFMEKIVQYPFEVPPVPMVVRRRWSRAILDSVDPMGDRSGWLHQEAREDLVASLATGLETPRAAQRLREQMNSLSALITNAEVDVLDFTALTWLRINHHRVWNDIRLNSTFYLSWKESDSEETEKGTFERLAPIVSRGHIKPVRDIVRFLFRPTHLAWPGQSRRGRMQNSRYFDRYFHVGLAEDDVSERKTRSALKDLTEGKHTSEDIDYLDAIILGEDPERSALAVDIASSERRSSRTSTPEILKYVETVRAALVLINDPHPFRLSATERWLAREIFLTIEGGHFSWPELIQRFGYQFLTASGYSVHLSEINNRPQVKDLFAEVAKYWIAEVLDESLDSTLARSELLLMTSFCIWTIKNNEYKGFLSKKMADAESLIKTAVRYVSFSEWVGAADVKFDVTFREEEFRFATAGASLGELLTGFPPITGNPDFKVTDRPDRDLTDAQRRDFAIRSLLTLDFDLSTDIAE